MAPAADDIGGQLALVCLHHCGVGFGGGGGRVLELWALFGQFFAGDLLNSYVDCSIKLCLYVDNTKYELTP